MKKKLMLSIGTLSTLLVITPIISCSSTSKVSNDSNESKLNESKLNESKRVSWGDQIANIPRLVQYQWEAEQITSMKSTIDFMNEKMGFYFPKPIAKLTPYDFANFVLNFYKQNGGGTIVLTMNYEEVNENIVLQLQKPLIDIIKSFDGSPTDGSPAIDANTQRHTGSSLGGILSIGAKLATGSNPIDALTGFWNLFGEYGQEIFGTDSIIELLSSMNSNIMLRDIVGLIEAFPASTLSVLPRFFGLFKTMAQQMSASVLGQKWAEDNNISEEFQNIDMHILEAILTSW